MDHQPASMKFAIIGHQDSWEHVMEFVNTIRITSSSDVLPLAKIKEVYTYIPARSLFDITVHSAKTEPVKGVYIETFISPDELNAAHLHKNISKVKDACKYVAELGVPIVSLGGFSSILLETGNESFTKIGATHFTTGNSLTAAFIAKGVENACAFWDQLLQQSNLLIIGATGDIGSACVEYFSGKVKQLLLCARQPGPLKKQSDELTAKGIKHLSSTSLKELVAKADIIISVASSIINQPDLELLSPHAIICDAGYPKNLRAIHMLNHERIFYGGMGIVKKGFDFCNSVHHSLYKFPVPNVSHGCLLESIVLAMENKYCAYSKGKGNITVQAMEEILAIANTHGIETAPLFNNAVVFQLHNKLIAYE